MSNYPDNFRGTNMDADTCVQCGRTEYTDELGVCDDCQYSNKIINAYKVRGVEQKMRSDNMIIAIQLGIGI